MTVQRHVRGAGWLLLPLAALSAAALAERDDAVPGRAFGSGIASYYAHSFIGKRTASGEPYRREALTAAHRSAPFGSRIRVRSLSSGREVTVRINDRGPHTKGRIIDLSWAAAEAIGLTRSGTAQVSLTLLAQ